MFAKYSDNRCYIVAEIGGNFTTAEAAIRLIDAAAACGVDAVKLQTYRADTVTSRVAMFDMENTGAVSQYDLFKAYEIDEALHRTVFDHARACELDWFSTPSHPTDVDLLERLGVGAYKIGSDDATNLPFLRHVARTGKPMMLSTGMCTLAEVRAAVDAVCTAGNERLLLLHAITSYPTHPEHVNLRALDTLSREFPRLAVGYSDHTIGPVACLCAAAMGARILEKHFTYDKRADGPDHALSADPEEMRWLVDAVRRFELMRGDGVKRPAASEHTTRINNRKSVVLARPARAGVPLTPDDVTVKRPGTGIEPARIDEVIGRTLRHDAWADQVLNWDDLR